MSHCKDWLLLFCDCLLCMRMPFFVSTTVAVRPEGVLLYNRRYG